MGDDKHEMGGSWRPRSRGWRRAGSRAIQGWSGDSWPGTRGDASGPCGPGNAGLQGGGRREDARGESQKWGLGERGREARGTGTRLWPEVGVFGRKLGRGEGDTAASRAARAAGRNGPGVAAGGRAGGPGAPRPSLRGGSEAPTHRPEAPGTAGRGPATPRHLLGSLRIAQLGVSARR